MHRSYRRQTRPTARRRLQVGVIWDASSGRGESHCGDGCAPIVRVRPSSCQTVKLIHPSHARERERERSHRRSARAQVARPAAAPRARVGRAICGSGDANDGVICAPLHSAHASATVSLCVRVCVLEKCNHCASRVAQWLRRAGDGCRLRASGQLRNSAQRSFCLARAEEC